MRARALQDLHQGQWGLVNTIYDADGGLANFKIPSLRQTPCSSSHGYVCQRPAAAGLKSQFICNTNSFQPLNDINNTVSIKISATFGCFSGSVASTSTYNVTDEVGTMSITLCAYDCAKVDDIHFFGVEVSFSIVSQNFNEIVCL